MCSKVLIDPSLFLGFKPDEAFEREVKKTNPYLVTLFIGQQDYLLEVKHQDQRYLGKFLQERPTLDQIEDLEKHLLSLLQKLAPNYAFSGNPPVLVTLENVK